MFGSANQKEKLENKYKKLLDESYRLSHPNRRKSDEKAAEADEIRKQMDLLEQAGETKVLK